MHAVLVERIPARAQRLHPLAIAIEIGLALAFVDDVVLARNIECIEPGLGDRLVGVVEFLGPREVRDVPGMQHECRLLRQRNNLGNRLIESCQRVRIGRCLESDVAVGDLQECESARSLRVRLGNSEKRGRPWYPARQRP